MAAFERCAPLELGRRTEPFDHQEWLFELKYDLSRSSRALPIARLSPRTGSKSRTRRIRRRRVATSCSSNGVGSEPLVAECALPAVRNVCARESGRLFKPVTRPLRAVAQGFRSSRARRVAGADGFYLAALRAPAIRTLARFRDARRSMRGARCVDLLRGRVRVASGFNASRKSDRFLHNPARQLDLELSKRKANPWH